MANNFTYDQTGLTLTEGCEGFRPMSYADVNGVLTIGYGHTGSDVKIGMVITKPEGQILLQSDVAAAVSCVNAACTVPLDQERFDALTDFTFNEGRTSFLHSTLLKDVNAGDFVAATAQFMNWVTAGGRRFTGLVRRRTLEQALFRQ